MDDGMEIQVARMDQLLDEELPGRPALANDATVEVSSGRTAEVATDRDAEEAGHQGSSLQVDSVASALAPEIASPPTTVEVTSGGDADQGGQDAPSFSSTDRSSHESAIKFLVPNSLAGSLIGKAGATIKEIQLQASCMVRIASSGMYYPGTMERVVLIAGTTTAVKVACALILHTIHRPNKSSMSGSPSLLEEAAADKVEVAQRLLIPLSAGGLIIGRKGANITALLKGSRAKVALGQKNEAKANERVVTVQGSLTAATKATKMLVDKLREEPATSRFANMSVNYRSPAHYNQAAAASSGASSATSRARLHPHTDQERAAHDGTPANADLAAADPDTPASSVGTPSTSATDTATQRIISPVQVPLTGGGVVPAIQLGAVAAGIRGPVRRRPPLQHHQQQQQQQQQHQPYYQQPQQQPQQQHVPKFAMRGPRPLRPLARGPQMTSMVQNVYPLGPNCPMPTPDAMRPMPTMRPLATSLPQAMGIPIPAHPHNVGFHPNMQAGGVSPEATAVPGGGGGGPAPCSLRSFQPPPQMFPLEPMTNPVAMAVAACQPTTMVSVGIPDSMVGAILGKGGSTINELQTLSGARITVSHRDDLMPGTENRILTISGLPMATQTAQYLVSQKIQAIASMERPRRRGGVVS